MTPDIEPETTDEEDVCPHCGAALDLARAMREERSVLKKPQPRARR